MTVQSTDAPFVASNPQPTFIDILLDETGSMSTCLRETVAGYDNFIAEQREVEGECYLTLSKFDSASIRTPYVNLPLDMVPELTFFPGAATNLYDVVGERLTAILNQPRQGRSLVVVITDGGENASRKFNFRQVNDLVKRAGDAGVTFLYFGAGNAAHQTALDMGFPDHAIKKFDTANMGETMKTISAETRAFRAAN